MAKRLVFAMATAALFAGTALGACDGYGESDGPSFGDTPVSSEGGAGDAGSDACAADLAIDPLNCGRCGHDCLGGPCAAGHCDPVTLVDWDLVDERCATPDAGACFTGTIASVVIDDTWAYFSDNEPGGLRHGGVLRVKKDGPARQKPETLNTSGAIRRLGADDSSLFWAPPNRILRMALDGGAVAELSSTEADSDALLAPVRVGNDLLFGTRDGVRRLALGGAGASAEAFPDAGEIGSVLGVRASGDGAIVVWAVTPTNGGAISFRENGTTKLVAIQQNVSALALDGRLVYWANGDGSIYTADLGGPIVPTLHAKTDQNPMALVVDGDDLYVGTWGKNVSTAQGIVGSLFKMPKKPPSGTLHVPDVLFQGPVLVSDVAVDARAIYFTAWFSPTVLRLAK